MVEPTSPAARGQMMSQPLLVSSLIQHADRHFGGRYRHTMRRGADGTLKIQLQRVDLFNAQAPFDYVIQIWV